MVREAGLLERLKEYGKSDYYPFHMPGHKRQWEEAVCGDFPNPFSIDITEIKGFDNLHNPEGILKDSMEWAADIYGADRTYYLVNGSSCGILSAICGVTHNSDTILMSRNSHKSAYHGVFLNHLTAEYIYPQLLGKYCVQGGLLPDEIEGMLKTHCHIKAVFIVSPTYDGIISDIKTISTICHKYKIPLIVDEAHGAHFCFGKEFPVSALDLGADAVIQSVHKTLPSLTQTALLHVRDGYVDVERVERYLSIYQSSSPSYLLMAGIENCIRYMDGPGRQLADDHMRRIEAMREELGALKCLRIMGREVIGRQGVYDLDLSKIIISTCGTGLTGVKLDELLRERYHLEMEMCTEQSVTAITSIMDSTEGLERLKRALFEIDRELTGGNAGGKGSPGRAATEDGAWQGPIEMEALPVPKAKMTIFEAVDGKRSSIPWTDSVGRISGEYVYVYPPGIPIIAPGEVLEREIVDRILNDQILGLAVQGTRDRSLKTIEVVEEF